MEAALWYVLSRTRGGTNRARILQALDERPRVPESTYQRAASIDRRDTPD